VYVYASYLLFITVCIPHLVSLDLDIGLILFKNASLI